VSVVARPRRAIIAGLMRVGAALLPALLAGALAFAGAGAGAMAPSETPSLQTYFAADATLQPEGQPEVRQRVVLRHRWDIQFPGLGGRAVYSIALPAADPATQSALLIERVGNQAIVRLNGTVVRQIGTPGDLGYDAAKVSQVVTLPTNLLFADRPNALSIEVTTQAMRGGGLSQVDLGPLSVIEERHGQLRFIDQTLSAAYAASLLLMGGLAAGLWWRQRDALYGTFGAMALCGVLRQFDHLGPEDLLPWPAWGIVFALAFGCHLALMPRVLVMLVRPVPAWMKRAFDGVLATVMALAVLAYWLRMPALWTTALGLLEAQGVACMLVVAREAVQGRSVLARGVLAACVLLLATGLHDILLVRLGVGGSSNIGLTAHAMFLLVVMLAGVVVARYSRSVDDYRALNANLAERIAERERQLGEAFETLRREQQDRAVMGERQRIMGEIHDGIGSQLVGMLNMIDQKSVDTGALANEIRLALDEMRMAVDSLQPMQGDLTTVLAMLRYRLQPRLQAARLEVAWEVDEFPPLADLSPHAILQIQRLLLEAFTNVLKHARATRVRLRAQWRDSPAPVVRLQVCDDGIGVPPGAPAGAPYGRGVASMRSRAAAIGAVLRIEAGDEGGTCVDVEWPVAAPPGQARAPTAVEPPTPRADAAADGGGARATRPDGASLGEGLA
jgi:hypothetical protein